MRRDYFTLQVSDAAWIDDEDAEPVLPQLLIEYEGPAAPFLDSFKRGEGPIPGDEIDVAYRLQDPIETTDAAGVLSITDRFTGEFLLELNAPAEMVVPFLRAARRYGESEAESGGRYHIEVHAGDDQLVYEKRTLLVYNNDGSLLRRHSLIPSGVEL